MERITGAVYLDQAQTDSLKGGHLIEPANQMIMLTSLSTCMLTSMGTILLPSSTDSSATCDHDSSATAD